MKFSEIIDQASTLLRRKGRISYRALKMEFDLDDDQLDVLKEELLFSDPQIEELEGRGLAWIGDRDATSTARRPSADQPATTPSADVTPPEAERRQLTVMFCDIVGATHLSEELDPEELREIVRAYQQASAEVIDRFDGHIAQYLGDGLLVYFGYPKAHEDDAERAVRAGLGIVAALRDLNMRLKQPIQVRVGLHTGPVVVGVMGGGQRYEQLALGETPNVAARIQALAAADTVVMSGATHQLVEGLFTSDALGAQTVKGIATPVPLYQVTGESEAHSRFEASVKTGLTPMVGREEEVGLLERHWAQVKDGDGQVVMLIGEAGIGKSRLVQVLKEHVLQDGTPRIEYRCSPYYQNTAFYPIIDHLERLLQFAPRETGPAKFEKLERLLAEYHFPQDDTLALFASLLSIPLPAGRDPLDLSPERQKQMTNEALVAWIVEESERHAVYCAWEDLHWADPSTMEFLEFFLDHVPTARLLAVVTFRPEFRPPWELHSHINHITLSRLGRDQVEQMVSKVTEGKTLPREVMQQIVTKTDGVPLFVEELTKMVVESGLLRAAENHYELSGPLPPLAIPSTLQDSLMARLDRLASARELAQLGATLGREFSYDLICAVSSVDEAALQRGLAQLVEAELIYRKGAPPQASYLFKHALIRDTAYQSLLKAQRHQFHQRIAQVLEQQFPEVVASQPELLAHHYTEAGLAEEAVSYWQQAGQRAVQRSANAEAVGHFTAALEVLQTLPDTLDRNRRELALQVALGTPVAITGGWSSAAAGKVYNRALELCGRVGDTPQLFPTVYGLWSFYNMRAEYPAAQEAAQQLLTRGESAADPGLLIEAHVATGFTSFWLGQFRASRAHCEAGIALYDPARHRSHVDLYRREPGMACLAIAAWALWPLGYPDQAAKSVYGGISLGEESLHPFSLAYALAFASLVHQFRREGRAAEERAEGVIALATEHGFPFWLGWGTVMQGRAVAAQGRAEEGIAQIRDGLVTYRATGAEMGRSYILAWLAEALGKAGRAEEGLATLAEALAFVEQTEERIYEAEIYRLKGELTLQSRTATQRTEAEEEARVCFHKALAIARQQHAKSWELRAAVSLARLAQQQGETIAAHNLLSEICGWFTEGFDTKDLLEAKSLVDEWIRVQLRFNYTA